MIWGLSAGKPMLVGEYGTVEGTPGAKAAWFRQADYSSGRTFRAIRASCTSSPTIRISVRTLTGE